MKLKNKILIEGDTLNILENTELDTLQSLLDSHDWYYMMSDDPRVWNKGEAEKKEIENLVKSLGAEGKALYNAKYKEIFGKELLMEDSLMINGKFVKTYTQNGDKSYNVVYDDGTKDIIMVSHNDWDSINKLHHNSINESKKSKNDPAEKKKAEKTNYGHKDMSDVDMVNPYELKKGIRIEMVDTDDYEKAMDKAVKKLKKDPMFYSNLISNNKVESKRADVPTEIKDKKLNKVSDKLKDKANDMEVAKKDASKKNANDSLNKKEKASGKPKGVKEMPVTPKKVKGVKSMDVPGKEKTINIKESISLLNSLKKLLLP